MFVQLFIFSRAVDSVDMFLFTSGVRFVVACMYGKAV